MSKYIIGADGGGTGTCLAALDLSTGLICARAECEGINSYNVGTQRAAQNLLNGIRTLKLPENGEIIALSIGDPALDDCSDAPADCLQNHLLSKEFFKGTKIYTHSDVFMALYALSRGRPAALIAAGTGSMEIALHSPYLHGKRNPVATVGGWGFPSDDPGSGYYIATRGIAAAIDAFDGIAKSTRLCDAVTGYFSAAAPRGLIDILNGGSVSRAFIAGFAVQVDALAREGDETAKEILELSGCYLGRYALSLLDGIGENRVTVGICGSVLENSEGVRDAFTRTVRKTFPDALIEVPEHTPEEGAILYAADALGIEIRI